MKGTSKAYTSASLGEVSTFGFRGEGTVYNYHLMIVSFDVVFFYWKALASAADLSCLEISTRTARSRESWSVILKVGDCLGVIDDIAHSESLYQGGRSIYNGPSIRWRREYPGTVVSIRDAFYNVCANLRIALPGQF